MANFNKVVLMGNLTRDPEVRYTPKGTAICQLGLAINRFWKDESGADKEEVTFVDVEVWGKQAETCGQYLSKGRQVFVEGSIRTRSYDDKDGRKVWTTEVVADDVILLGGRGESGGAGGGPGSAMSEGFSQEPPASGMRSAPRGRSAAAAQPAASMNEGITDDDVPF